MTTSRGRRDQVARVSWQGRSRNTGGMLRGEEKFIRTEASEAGIPKDLRDPLVLGAFIHKLAEERKTTNKMFNRILARLEKMSELERKVQELEARLKQKEHLEASVVEPKQALMELPLLSEADERIMRFASKRGKCYAEEVQREFGYRGSNAASFRLNRLAEKGLLRKARVGKKIAFLPAAPFTSPSGTHRPSKSPARANRAKHHASMSFVERHGTSSTHRTTSTC